MINTEQILEAIMPSFTKGIIIIIIITILQIIFLKWLKKFKTKEKSKDSKYIQELKRTITKLTNENKALKSELKNV